MSQSNTFTYRGITFCPYGNVPKEDSERIPWKLYSFCLTPEGWDHGEFYKTATEEVDLFTLPELGDLVVIPCGNDLFAYRDEVTEKNPVFQKLEQSKFLIHYRNTTGLFIAGCEIDEAGLTLRLGDIGIAKVFADNKEAERVLNALPPFLYQIGYRVRVLSLKERLQHVLLNGNEHYRHPTVELPRERGIVQYE